MKIHIRLIANQLLLNALVSEVENYCENHNGFKIDILSSSVYWKSINLRECNLCLNVNVKYSR